MSNIFGGFSKGLNQGMEMRQKKRSANTDEMVKYAQLSELGYQVPGMTIQRDPSFLSTKDLERQELQGKIEEQSFKNEARKKFGQGPMFGESGNSSMVYDPVSGAMKNNPAYVKPLNPLDQRRMDVLGEKQKSDIATQQNKTEMAQQEAEGQLSAIQEAKKGKRFFGFAGDLPTKFAPSSLYGEYGPRKEWENNVNKLLSGRIITVMNQMKQASRTGATGFGQLNQSELRLLQDASNVLSRDLPPDIAMKYLEQLEPIYQKMLGGGPRSEQRFGQPPVGAGGRGGQQFNSPDEADASGLPPGTVVMVQGRRYQI